METDMTMTMTPTASATTALPDTDVIDASQLRQLTGAGKQRFHLLDGVLSQMRVES
jgi:hypothetical protein